MMRKIFFAMILKTSLSGFAQEVENDSIYKTSEVDKLPEFSGGIANFYKFVASKFVVQSKRKYKGKIITEFVIEKEGSLSNLKTISDFEFGSGDVAIRVFKLSPKWSPAEKKRESSQMSLYFSIKNSTRRLTATNSRLQQLLNLGYPKFTNCLSPYLAIPYNPYSFPLV
jgi:hypothetical protein